MIVTNLHLGVKGAWDTGGVSKDSGEDNRATSAKPRDGRPLLPGAGMAGPTVVMYLGIKNGQQHMVSTRRARSGHWAFRRDRKLQRELRMPSIFQNNK